MRAAAGGSQLLRRFWRDEDAPTAIEYALMLSGIALVIVAVVLLLGRSLGGFFESFELSP